jgi:DNA primase
LIEAEFSTNGIIEKPDIIGAIFGQTEGLLGQDLDLRELQKTGRIGRIEVELNSEEGKTSGKIMIPSSLDSSETSLIAASLETIERIGPYESKIKVVSVKDVRGLKREFVINRAKDILQNLIQDQLPSTSALTEKIKDAIRTSQIKEYEGLPCGPDIPSSDEIIVVEGRADVLNLLKNGIKNVIAINGAKIPQAIIDLSKEKLVTLFVDGDRGGELIIKEFAQLADIDYIARAPPEKEVEELSKKEIFKALRERISIEQYKIVPKAKELKEFIKEESG